MQVWEDGQAFKDVHAKLRALAEQRESIEAARKATKRRLPLPGQALPADPGAAAAGGVLHPDDWVVQVGVRPCWLAGWRQAAEAAGQTRGYYVQLWTMRASPSGPRCTSTCLSLVFSRYPSPPLPASLPPTCCCST